MGFLCRRRACSFARALSLSVPWFFLHEMLCFSLPFPRLRATKTQHPALFQLFFAHTTSCPPFSLRASPPPTLPASAINRVRRMYHTRNKRTRAHKPLVTRARRRRLRATKTHQLLFFAFASSALPPLSCPWSLTHWIKSTKLQKLCQHNPSQHLSLGWLALSHGQPPFFKYPVCPPPFF
jgi:hypothetical protein